MLPHMEALGAGSAGPGKSMCLLMDPFSQIAIEHQRCANPNHPFPLKWGQSKGRALHLRRTSPMLTETIDRSLEMFPQIDPNAEWRQSSLEWRFPSGFKFMFGHCKDPNDWMQYQSKSYTHIAYDELVQFTEEQYDQINTRLRSSDPVLGGNRELGLRGMMKIRAMSNPVMGGEHMEGVASHDRLWVRKRFVDRNPSGHHTFFREVEIEGRKERWDWIYLPARLTDNPDPNFIRNYMKNLASAKPHIRAALLDGDWYVTAHSYFGDVWDAKRHVIKSFKIPKDWPVFRSMDWGYKTHGCVHWWTLDRDGNLICIKEYTFLGKEAPEVARRIKDIEETLGLWDKKKRKSGISGVADTQLWERRGDVGKSKAEEMQAIGVMWFPAEKVGTDRGRMRNAQRIHQRLKDAPLGELPGLAIFEECTDLIRTLPALQGSTDNPDEPMDGGDDHWIDSMFYAGAFASYGPKGVGKRRVDSDDDDKREDVKVEVRGHRAWGYGS